MNNYLENRKKLIDKLEDDSLLVLYSGALKQSSYDESFPFVVNMNFFYVTGIEQDNVYLMIEKTNGEINESLFVYKNDPVLVRWIGAYLEKDEATKISDVKNVYYVEEFDDIFKQKIQSNSFKNLYLDLEEPDFKGQVDFGFVLKEKAEKLNQNIQINDAYNIVTRIRGVKQDYEIEDFKKAVEITKVALEEVMSNITNLNNEFEAQAIFEGSIMYQANCRTSFNTIAAGGKNAAILHYSSNNQKLNREDMILMDLGACYNKYRADITRTYPLSGKFSPMQKKIYSIVLGCNKMVIENAKEGVSIKELQQMTIEYLANGMMNIGIIQNKEQIKNYYFHGISHHIGLDTHDPYPDYSEPLKAGMIISDEPGLYIEELGIGVRIEDDLLITHDGCIVLSKDIIKEIDDIENFILEHKKGTVKK